MVMTVKPDMTKIWAATGATAAPPDAKIASGWGYEMMPFEWENWIQNRNDTMLSYLNQRGIPEWDSSTEYFAGKSYVTGANGVVYSSILDSVGINPTSDVSGKWVRAFPSITGGGAGGTWSISITGNAATASAVAWANISGKPATVAGYGITDSMSFGSANGSTAGAANGVAYLSAGKVLTAGSGLTFDGGNLGLGVVPAAWGPTIRAAQVAGASIGGSVDGLTGYSNANTYYDGTNWRYIVAGNASQYYQTAGQHTWRTAGSGAAGAAISFTQAMTLDASGSLLVGATATGYQNANSISLEGVGCSVVNHATGTSDGTFYLAFGYAGAGIGSITQAGTTAVTYNTSSDYRLKNITGPVTNSGAYIDSLNPVEGSWKADGSTFVGLIAHEVQEASRTRVATGVKDGEEIQAMDYSASELIANMIAELKSLRARVAALETI